MEHKYLYNYLEYQKNHNKNKWKKLMRIPWHITALILVSFVSLIATFILYLCMSNNTWVLVLEMIAIITAVIAYIIAEQYSIKHSKTALEDYANSRKELNEWLKSVHLDSKEKKELLLSRLNEYIAERESKEKVVAERSDKWLQVLFIPVVLSIITAVISHQNNTDVIVASTLFILMLFGMFYGGIALLRTIYNLPSKREIAQLKSFADDIQSTLDMEQLGWDNLEF